MENTKIKTKIKMELKICLICLHTNIPLLEVKDERVNYFLKLCCSKKKHITCLLCPQCLGRITDHLRFRNKCVKSYKILQEWKKKKKNQAKPPLETLHHFTSNNDDYINKATRKRQNRKSLHTTEEEKLHLAVQGIKREYNNIYYNYEDFTTGHEESMNHDDNEMKYEGTNDLDNYNHYYTNVVNVSKPKRVKKVSEPKPKRPKVFKEYGMYAEIFDVSLFNSLQEAKEERLSRLLTDSYHTAKFKCELCYKTFKQNGQQTLHQKCHNPSATLECPACRFRFFTRKSLNNHTGKCHRGKFSCKRCPLVTYHESIMKKHMDVHLGKTYTCDCGIVFRHKTTYQSHLRVRTREQGCRPRRLRNITTKAKQIVRKKKEKKVKEKRVDTTPIERKKREKKVKKKSILTTPHAETTLVADNNIEEKTEEADNAEQSVQFPMMLPYQRLPNGIKNVFRCEICRMRTYKGTERRIIMARFPLDPERCKKWVSATGNHDLIYLPIEKLHALKTVCGNHFTRKDFNSKMTRLRRTAVPTVNISKHPIPEEDMTEFPLYIASKVPLKCPVLEHDYHGL